MKGPGTTVLPLIGQAVDRAPDSVAVRGPDATLTYGELSRRADRLARRLRQCGVQSGDVVGQCLDRSAGLVVAALAILRTGGAYVAIDPEYPDERVRWMLEDSAATAVVTDERNGSRLGALVDCPGVVVAEGGELRDDWGLGSAVPLTPPPLPTDLAYVVYTSGSTGRPKGAMVEHARSTRPCSSWSRLPWHRTLRGRSR